MSERPTCETCRFWDGGECHRWPPTIHPELRWGDDYQNEGYWPHISKNDWCGEHEPRPEEKP